MKINILLDEGEDFYNAMTLASSIVDFICTEDELSPTISRWRRKLLEEVVKHLQVYCECHPTEKREEYI